ncbi:heterokaryon incompatibility protein-domain-containing protein [Diaporthe sp. PMI_573]|nr:heterokaryon incompatibility protein-domain-containing protein [Diaporthaceae sp. PMI_573]
MLCRMCRDNLGNVRIRYNHHNSPESFYNAIEAECFICRSVWQKIVEVSDTALYESGDWVPQSFEQFLEQLQPHLPEEDAFWSYAAKANPPEPDGLPFSVVRNESRRHNTRALEFAVKLRHDLAQISFRRVQDDHSAEMTRNQDRDPPGSAWSTSQNPHFWKQWLRQCSTSHSKCHAIRDRRQFSPSRLVEIIVQDSKAADWRIIEQTGDDRRPYCTLSHCWGKSLHFCLQQQNYNDLLAGQAMADLPKTYREACEVATSLGFSHIWIDSLCTVQDNVADWETESAVMGRIYEGAVVNIAATCAADGSLGLYHGRDPATVLAPDIGEGNTRLARLRMYTDDIEEAPLNTRAWVLQERYLAPGQLSFTRNQV